MPVPDSVTASLVAFEDRQVRRKWHNNEWWFSVFDVVGVLTDSVDPRNYWKVLKKRLSEQEGSAQTVTNCNQLKLPAAAAKRLIRKEGAE